MTTPLCHLPRWHTAFTSANMLCDNYNFARVGGAAIAEGTAVCSTQIDTHRSQTSAGRVDPASLPHTVTERSPLWLTSTGTGFA